MKGQAAWGKLLLQLHSLVHSTRLQLVSVHFCVSEDGREVEGEDGAGWGGKGAGDRCVR